MIRYMYPCLILMILVWSLIYVLDHSIPVEIRVAYRNWAKQEVFRIGFFTIENRHLLVVGEFLISFIIFYYFYYNSPRIVIQSKKEKEVRDHEKEETG